MLLTLKDALPRLFLCHCVTRTLVCLLLVVISLPAVAENLCPNSKHHTASTENAYIKYIHDGDTLHLKDGRKVRLIGINTPEVANKRKPAEAFAVIAKTALRAQFKNSKSITLLPGIEPYDRYNRLLAHGFSKDDSNIQATLLAQGYAYAIAIPPNTRFAACYLQYERQARCNKKGLWKKPQVLTAKNLKNKNMGFALIQGELLGIKTNKKGIWLNLDNKLTVAIRADNRSLFDVKNLNKMRNKQIVIRGWLNKSKKSKSNRRPFYMRIRHPAALQLASTFACN